MYVCFFCFNVTHKRCNFAFVKSDVSFSKMNFSYDVIDRRRADSHDALAVRWHSPSGRVLDISNADLQHHSDVTAYYLRRMGVGVGSVVFLYGLERAFEFATVLTALGKLCAVPVVDLRLSPVERCNRLDAYCIIALNSSSVVPVVDSSIMLFRSLELKISVGYPYPRNWFDLHTGVRLAGTFRRPADLPLHYTSLVVYDEHPIYYDETYPFRVASSDSLWDKFFIDMREGRPFEF